MANTSELSSVPDDLTVQQEKVVQEHEAVQKQEAEPDEQADNMSILAHLTELRRRILYSLLGVAIGSAIAYGFLDRIMAWLAFGKLQDGEGGLVCVPDEGCWRGGAFV